MAGLVQDLWRSLVERVGGRALATAREQALRAEQRLRDAIDALPEGIVFLDAEGRYVLWNQRYAEIYHRSADLFAPGARLADTLRVGVARGDYPDAVGREEAWLADRLERLNNPTGERHEQQIADGHWLMIEERRTRDGGVVGLRVDITAMKAQARALEEALAHAEAASRAKSEFLADMSHELRTPLNGVMGLAQALAAGELAASQRGMVADLLASANDLDQLVTGLLNYGTSPLASADRAAPSQDMPSLRVLAADDNPTNRKVVELLLNAAGAEVVVVENGAEAVEAWRQGRFDVVLMDLRMPVMDGLDAIREIRRAEAPGARAPIIVVSANTSQDDLAASSAAGADGHIGKPLKAEELFQAIESAIGPEGDLPADASRAEV